MNRAADATARTFVRGEEDPVQLVFELQSLVQGANASYQLLGDPAAFTRARAAVERRLG